MAVSPALAPLPHQGGADALLIRRSSLVHGLPAQVKLVALLAFVVVVVATPARAWPAFVAYAVLLGAVVRLARLPAVSVARRMLVETPFVVFALLMPFVASGPQVEVLGLSVSRSGLVGGALLLGKATLGVVAAIILAATTDARAMLVGLERLHLPSILVAIIAFAVRYLSIASNDLERARIARLARGGSGRRTTQLRSVAGTVGSTFVRTYERGERVHRAMLARGLDGPMPVLSSRAPSLGEWRTALLLPVTALIALVVAVVVA